MRPSGRRPPASVMLRGALTAVLLLWSGLPATANDDAPQGVLERLGLCKSLSLQDKDKAVDCLGTVTQTTDPDNHADFTFATRDGLSVRFRGVGAPRVDQNDGSFVQALDAVIVSKNDHPSRSRATGTCRFSTPGTQPSPIICRAQSWIGLFQAVFLADGRVGAPTGD